MKTYKIASVNVYVTGFQTDRSMHDLLDIIQYLKNKLYRDDVMGQIMGTADWKERSWMSFLEPDGSDWKEPVGIINAYVGDFFPTDKYNTLFQAIKYYLSEEDITVGQYKMDISNMTGKAVMRIPVIKNDWKPSEEQPPELNMSNANAYDIFNGILNLPIEDGYGEFDAWQVVAKIDKVIGPQLQEFTHEGIEEVGEGGASFITPSKDVEYFEKRLQQIKKVCEWAINNGYQKIYVA